MNTNNQWNVNNMITKQQNHPSTGKFSINLFLQT